MGLLAHQGGWDEILFILGPMALVVVLLRLAKRRVDRNLAAGVHLDPNAPPSSGPTEGSADPTGSNDPTSPSV